MSFPKDNNELEQALSEAFAPPPAANFDAWRQRHIQAVECLNPQRINNVIKRQKTLRRTVVIGIAAAVLAIAFLGTSFFASNRYSNIAFAEMCKEIEKQIEGAKTITWKTIYFVKISNQDGSRSWRAAQTNLMAYKAPGLYRDVRPSNGAGYIESVVIEDHVHGKKLKLFPMEKKAILYDLAEQSKEAIKASDIDRFTQMILQINENTKRLGKKEIDGKQAEGFRIITGTYGENTIHKDLWVYSESQHLAMIDSPGLDVYDPDKDPTRNNPPDVSFYSQHLLGSVTRDIMYNRELDDALFSLDPPEGYTVTTYHRAEITEKELIEWLGVLAEYYNQRFPDADAKDMPDIRDLNRILHKQEKARTPAEKKIAERFNTDPDICFHDPIQRFNNHTAGNTWHYAGKGVKLGDKDRIVCWYKLKDAKDQKTYRVVYGDLSVKDVAP